MEQDTQDMCRYINIWEAPLTKNSDSWAGYPEIVLQQVPSKCPGVCNWTITLADEDTGRPEKHFLKHELIVRVNLGVFK